MAIGPPRHARRALAALALAACAHAPQTTPVRPSAPRTGGELRFAEPAPATLDPARITTVYESALVNQLFDGLVAWDVNLMPVPGLARDWIVSRDGLDYRFRLRAGVRFHDGSAVEAADVVYSIERLLRLSRGQVSTTLEVLRSIAGADDFDAGRSARIAGLAAEGPGTVLVRLARPETALLQVLASDSLKVLPRRRVERDGDAPFGRAPIGSGPFRLAAWTESEVVLAANRAYFAGSPYLDRITVRVDPALDRSATLAAFLRGELDLLELTREERGALEGSRRFRLLERIEPGLSYLGFNVLKPPFDRAECRHAIARAVDRKALAAAAGPSVRPAESVVPSGMPGFPPLPPGEPSTSARAGSPSASDACAVLSALPPVEVWVSDPGADDHLLLGQLRSAGLDARFRVVPWAELDRATSDGRAGAFLLGLVADLPEARSFLYDNFHSRGAGNFYGYANSALDRLLDEAGAERDPRSRALLLRRAEQLLRDDAPIVPLAHGTAAVALQAEVRGLELDPFGLSDARYERVWRAAP